MELTHLAQHSLLIPWNVWNYQQKKYGITKKSMELANSKSQVPNLPTKIAPAGGKDRNSSDFPGVDFTRGFSHHFLRLILEI